MNTAAFSRFFALLAIASQAFVVGAIGLWLAGRRSPGARRVGRSLRDSLAPAALPIAWTVALVATAGSLYYSEVAGFVPCRLCWYQRIAMYPLVLVLGIALLRRDVGVRGYAIPLAVAGGLISAYHYQLQRFPGQGSLSCAAEAPCTLTWVWEFHYISIPLMALSAFATVTALLVLARSRGDEPVEELVEERGAAAHYLDEEVLRWPRLGPRPDDAPRGRSRRRGAPGGAAPEDGSPSPCSRPGSRRPPSWRFS